MNSADLVSVARLSGHALVGKTAGRDQFTDAQRVEAVEKIGRNVAEAMAPAGENWFDVSRRPLVESVVPISVVDN